MWSAVLWVTQMETSWFLSSPSLPSVWGTKSYLVSTFSVWPPTAPSLRRYSLPEQEQRLLDESAFPVSLIPCYRSSLPMNHPPPSPNQKPSKFPHWLWRRTLSRESFQAMIPTSNSSLTHTVLQPHWTTLLLYCTMLFFLPRCCSHCSLSLKCSFATQYSTLPLMASPTLPCLEVLPGWPVTVGRNLSCPQPHPALATLPIKHLSYLGFDSLSENICWVLTLRHVMVMQNKK